MEQPVIEGGRHMEKRNIEQSVSLLLPEDTARLKLGLCCNILNYPIFCLLYVSLRSD